MKLIINESLENCIFRIQKDSSNESELIFTWQQIDEQSFFYYEYKFDTNSIENMALNNYTKSELIKWYLEKDLNAGIYKKTTHDKLIKILSNELEDLISFSKASRGYISGKKFNF
jgi:hypothetical protein